MEAAGNIDTAVPLKRSAVRHWPQALSLHTLRLRLPDVAFECVNDKADVSKTTKRFYSTLSLGYID